MDQIRSTVKHFKCPLYILFIKRCLDADKGKCLVRIYSMVYIIPVVAIVIGNKSLYIRVLMKPGMEWNEMESIRVRQV